METTNITTYYQCHLCDELFTQYNELETHRKRHIEKENSKVCEEKELSTSMEYLCDICGKTYDQNRNIQAHMRVHTSTKRKRNDLSLADKYEVVKLFDSKISQSVIADKSGCSQSQVSRIFRNKDKIRKQFESNANPDRKRQRFGKSAEVEKALSEWFTQVRCKDMPLTGTILSEKAKELAARMNQDEFYPTSGWLQRWKGRNNFSYKKPHGEKKDSELLLSENGTQNVLPDILQYYDAEDIYHANETGIYFRSLPNGTITFKTNLTSSKYMKDCLSVLLTCNMTATDKRQLLIIGKTKQPRCFRGQCLPVDYTASSSAVMTGDIFTEWIHKFNRDMRLKKRKVLLIMDSCIAHPPNAAENLSHIKLSFFPTGSTGFIPPCNLGIIKNLKTNYTREIVANIMNTMETVEDLSASQINNKFRLLDVVHYLRKAWQNVKRSTITNCFRMGGFVVPGIVEDDDIDVIGEIPDGVTREAFLTCVESGDDLVCRGKSSDKDICESVLDEAPDQADDLSDDEDEKHPAPLTHAEVFNAWKVVRRHLGETGYCDYDKQYSIENHIMKSRH